MNILHASHGGKFVAISTDENCLCRRHLQGPSLPGLRTESILVRKESGNRKDGDSARVLRRPTHNGGTGRHQKAFPWGGISALSRSPSNERDLKTPNAARMIPIAT